MLHSLFRASRARAFRASALHPLHCARVDANRSEKVVARVMRACDVNDIDHFERQLPFATQPMLHVVTSPRQCCAARGMPRDTTHRSYKCGETRSRGTSTLSPRHTLWGDRTDHLGFLTLHVQPLAALNFGTALCPMSRRATFSSTRSLRAHAEHRCHSNTPREHD